MRKNVENKAENGEPLQARRGTVRRKRRSNRKKGKVEKKEANVHWSILPHRFVFTFFLHCSCCSTRLTCKLLISDSFLRYSANSSSTAEAAAGKGRPRHFCQKASLRSKSYTLALAPSAAPSGMTRVRFSCGRGRGGRRKKRGRGGWDKGGQSRGRRSEEREKEEKDGRVSELCSTSQN